MSYRKMKVTEEHYNIMAEAIQPFNNEENRLAYKEGRFPRADKVKDVNVRYRWDLYYAARRTHYLDFSHEGESLYNGEHIDTALRNIVEAL